MDALRRDLCDPTLDIAGWHFDCPDLADGVEIFPCSGAMTIQHPTEPSLVIRCTCFCHAERRGLAALRLHILYFPEMFTLFKLYRAGLLNEKALDLGLVAAESMPDAVPYGTALGVLRSLN